MVGLIILSIYIIGLVVSALIFPKLFPYEEGMWEMFEGEAMPIDEEDHMHSITAMCFIWPLVLTMIIVVVLPIKCIEYLNKVI
jgi:hypothetical protein